MSQPLAIRLLTPRDVNAVDALLTSAYGVTGRGTRVLRMLTVDPTCFAAAFREGVMTACGGFAAYPDGGFGWVGLIATAPGHERRGLGTSLTEWCVDALVQRGCRPVLDASDKGAPVYERMGFVDFGLAGTWTRRPTPTTRAGPPPVGQRDLDALLELDRHAFGADRGALLSLLAATGHLHRVTRGGTLSAFAFQSAATLGPIVALDADALDELLSRVTTQLPSHEPARLCVPPDCVHREVLRRHGFGLERTLRHMRRPGHRLPGARTLLVAMASYAEG